MIFDCVIYPSPLMAIISRILMVTAMVTLTDLLRVASESHFSDAL